MTNYYVKFDENGTQSETRFGLDQENPLGWIDTGLTNIDDKLFKFVNNQVVEMTKESVDAMYKELKFNSQVKTARMQRDNLLASCDWTQVEDVALSSELKQSWATYRQALRDLPSTVDENGEFTLPVAPDSNFNPLGLL
jgi:hypothetical protein